MYLAGGLVEADVARFVEYDQVVSAETPFERRHLLGPGPFPDLDDEVGDAREQDRESRLAGQPLQTPKF